MPRALSNDVRERVLARYETEGSIRKVAAIFGIAPSTVSKWVQRRRETGSVAPKKIGGYRRPVLEPASGLDRSKVPADTGTDPERASDGAGGPGHPG